MEENSNITQVVIPSGTDEKELSYPIVTTTNEEDGSVKVSSQSEDGTITWEKTFQDGKKITFDETQTEVTWLTDGSIEFEGKKGVIVSIKKGNGQDVIDARKTLKRLKAIDEDAFTMGLMAQLTRFNGKFMPWEAIPEYFSSLEFINLENYFKKVNFT
jgi:hypothetical protein